MFETTILAGSTNEPHLNIGYTDAFEQVIDPDFPEVLRLTLCCFLTIELSLIDSDLAETVETACLIEFENATQQAPDGKLLNLPKFQELHERIRRLESDHNSESGALTY